MSGSVTGFKRCVKCGKGLQMHSGIVFANFGHARMPGLDPCKGTWCGKCYTQAEKDAFPVLAPRDLEAALMDDAHMEEDDDPLRFKEGQEGDHLFIRALIEHTI
jgi:hypothetical protein